MDVPNTDFAHAGTLEVVKAKGRIVVHGAHRPILVVYDRGRVFALDNRCPHMGFPASRRHDAQRHLPRDHLASPGAASATHRPPFLRRSRQRLVPLRSDFDRLSVAPIKLGQGRLGEIFLYM
jgi:nitrite reductase/ring-hydroxylating ferredoxin subunit